MCLAFLRFAQFGQQPLNPLAVVAAVPRGVQAGAVAERADAEAGVVRERQGAAVLCGGSGLEAGVSEEGAAGFLHLHTGRHGTYGNGNIAQAGLQHPGELAHLAGIAAGDDQNGG